MCKITEQRGRKSCTGGGACPVSLKALVSKAIGWFSDRSQSVSRPNHSLGDLRDTGELITKCSATHTAPLLAKLPHYSRARLGRIESLLPPQLQDTAARK